MHILILAEFIPYPSIGGDRVRLAGLLDWLKESGHECSYLLLQTERVSEKGCRALRKRCSNVFRVELRPWPRRLRHIAGGFLRFLLEQFSWGRNLLRQRMLKHRKKHKGGQPFSVDILSDDRMFNQVANAVRRMPIKPEVVICEYAVTTHCFEIPELRESLKIVDTLDVLHQRGTMFEKGLEPWRTCSREEEVRYLKRADIIMAIQEEEASTFCEMVPDRAVICVGQSFIAQKRVQKKSEKTCLLLGTAHSANLEGLAWFQTQVWPLILSEIPSAKLLVAGPMSDYALRARSVERLGIVENLEPLYERTAVAAVPIFSGTGLKIKLVEALSKGKAVVATSHAAKGVNGNGVFLIADDSAFFACHLIALLQDSELRQNFEKKAFSFAQEFLSPERVYSPLATLLEQRQMSGAMIS